MLISKVIRKTYIIIKRAYYTFFCRNICIGKGLNFRRNFLINVSKNGKVEIGNNVFFNNEVTINAHSKVSIGDNCIFGENVKIYDHNHVFSDFNKPIYLQGYNCREVKIGNGCWIGSNATILPGSNIGNNTIIGAGCVILGSIGSGMIVTAANRELIIKRRN